VSGQRHKYEYQVNIADDTASARVVRMVGQGKRVLEIGAGPGSITKILHNACGCRVTALEIDPTAIEKLAPYCEQVCQADLNDPDWPRGIAQLGRFDVVVAADVLEHVNHPPAVLGAMKEFLREGGHLVISLPHAGHSAVHACLFDENFEYRDWGLLDRTHIRFFGLKNIQSLFEEAALKIVAAEFVVRKPEQTEFAARWAAMPAPLKAALAGNPYGLVYQVVIKAVPLSAAGSPLRLMELPVEQSAPAQASRLRAFARRWLPLPLRTAIRRVLSSLGVA
jgi:2-polyprenyl-3-methyl-5-hydroxy-6-metoxy-1,4-benzoquinol methylase